MPPNAILAADGPDWNAVADRFCAAWTSPTGTPDFDTLGAMYAPDPDIVIYDSLAPLDGFRGFAAMRSGIYVGLASLDVHRTGEVEERSLANGAVVVISYPMRFAYAFDDGRRLDFDARMSEVWELRGDRYVIVHEHPSTVLPD